MGGSGRLRYQPALDGARALAVLAVVAYHLDWGWAKGGFLGVDAFFVLSGYLITGLLVGERAETGRISLGAFYGRRVRRLMPALLLVLGAVALYWAFAVPADRLATLRADGIASLFYVANWHLVVSGQSYFALFTEPSPLRHLWSLAIEEQFYLVWPLFVILMLRRGSRRALSAACAVGVVASVVLMALLYDPLDPMRAYYGTDTRIHEILIGALFALVPAGSALHGWFETRAARVGSVLAAVVCLVALVTVSDRAGLYYRGGSFVFSVLVGFVLVTSVTARRTPTAQVLSIGVLLWIGLRSYGIYLLHWPVIVYLDASSTGLHGLALDAVRIAVTFALAALSFALIERPVREGRFPLVVRRALAPAGFAAVLAAIVVATGGATAPSPLATAVPGDVLELEPVRGTPAPGSVAADAGGAPPVSAPPPAGTAAPSAPGTLPLTGGVASAGAPSPAVVLLLGDSVGYTLASRLRDGLGRFGHRMESTAVMGCGVLEGVTIDPTTDRPFPWSQGCHEVIPGLQRDRVAEVHPDLVLLISTWETADRDLDGSRIRLGTADGDARLLGLLDAAVGRLTAGGARVLLTTVIPPVDGDEHTPTADDVRRALDVDRLYRRYAAAHADRVSIVDLAGLACPEGPPCPREIDGIRLRPRDGLHFEDPGAIWVAAWFAPLVDRCRREPANGRCGDPTYGVVRGDGRPSARVAARSGRAVRT